MFEDGNKFRQIRRITALSKFCLSLLEDIRQEHDKCMENLLNSSGDLEEHWKSKGQDINVSHLMHHAHFFDEDRFNIYRKKVLDFSNDIKREIDKD